MTGNEHRLKLLGTIIAFIGVIGGLAGGAVAYLDYRGKAELEALRSLHDAQLLTCRDVSNAASHLFSANDQEQFDKALTSFAELKHGAALTILDKSVLDQMVDLYNAAITIDSKDHGQKFRHAVISQLCDKPFQVALQCRKMLAKGYRDEVGEKIQILDDSYVIGWSTEPCKAHQ
jgi:hypothetical protein